MSTNTTNTSNGAGRPKAAAAGTGNESGAVGQEFRFPFATFPMPDAPTIERLANEFFRAMPRDLANGDGAASPSLGGTESEEIPVTMFEGAPPPTETSDVKAPSSFTAPPQYTQPGPLTETDLRAIAASLADQTTRTRGVPGGAPTPPVSGSVPGFVGETMTSPLAVSPTLASGNDLFSFPYMPDILNSSRIQTPQSSSSLPASLSGAPLNDSGPAQSHDVKGISPQVPGSANIAPTSAQDHSGAVEYATYPSAMTKLPMVSDLFSFPGVPGVQSAPGIPGMPTSVGAPHSTQQPTSPSAGFEAFEFRPEVAPGGLGIGKRPLDARLIRRDFPILEERVHGQPLVWLDNAATTQKPNAVIDRLSHFYRHENSNIHRAAHELAARATDAYESAREKTRRFLNASSTREIVFVRGTTEAINLVAQSWGRRNVREGDEVVITWLEHHANIVPWQMLCSEKGARLRVAPVNDRGEIILEEYEKLLGPRTRIVAFSQVSNALGTVTPAREMIEIAHRYGARVLLDGAQSISHMPVDVQALDSDFFVFSGHKVFGPTGIGVLHGKQELLDSMPPWQGGGNMINDVTFERTSYQVAPARFEAGTGNIADAVGLGAALDYVDEIGRENISAYEHDLLNYGTEKLLTVPGLRLIGTAREKAGVLSFVLDDVRTEDVGVALNQDGIAVRAGHHCAQPILRRMGVESTVRPSLAFYNTCEDIDALVAALLRLQAARGHGKR